MREWWDYIVFGVTAAVMIATAVIQHLSGRKVEWV